MKPRDYYSLRITGTTPAKIPMARLAEYMLEMAKLMGETDGVHFRGVVKGSVAVRAITEADVAEPVSKRVALSAIGEGPREAMMAIAKINEMLGEDKAKADFKSPSGAVIIQFPGKKPAQSADILVTEEGQIEGRVIKIGGRDETIPLWLLGDDGVEYHCTVRGESLAKAIAAHYLGGTIRVYGRGKWRRTQDGRWLLENLTVSDFQELSDDWDASMQTMQIAASGWTGSDIEAECVKLRRG